MSVQPVRILDIGDMQNGFLRERGSLSIPGAQDIIGPAQEFLDAIHNGIFNYTFIILDTHFTEEYSLSEESGQFPIHCEYGTNDWEPSVSIAGLPGIRYLMKNQFSMWGSRPSVSVVFPDPARQVAYDRLFCFSDDPQNPQTIIPRDAFIRSICPDQKTSLLDVTLMGVASDYCNRYAMEGWLMWGARVTILYDLTRGIGKETPDVIAEDCYRCFGQDRLRVISSREFLQEHGLPSR